ncbi:unnamed protein product [Cyberlindnera jadinii]|uniref:Uncharacterized protein n=1 Tax=Cyberlindnera jadinii (strain ATCC 18201 / CBS 1600 / BCRC 20928 / JCM 3617 / NBRC 0987 / NRRL Y-1542) TaxID=983966 RepID=A0A0H5CCC9_CYBJN|nr:unnamed protein product [Cyberlindnera jadinii]
MEGNPKNNQCREPRLGVQGLNDPSAKAEAWMPFLKDGHSIYAIQQHSSGVSLNTEGSNGKYFAALLSLPVDGREGDVVAYIISHVQVSSLHSFLRMMVLIRIVGFH